jgi:pimeloyl-ACP methyl ester carboxylesterase
VRRYAGTTPYHDEARAIAVDGAGNVYVTGDSYDSGSDYDYVTIKYSQGPPPRRVVLFIKGTPSDGDCKIDGWATIRDNLKTRLVMANSDFLEYDYTSGNDTAQQCEPPDDQFVQYDKYDSCWSLNDAWGASCLSGNTGQGERLATYLNTYLEANPNVNLSIVGHSQGGLLAVYALREFASQYPSLGRIGSVVTLDSPLKGITRFSSGVFRKHWQGCGSLDSCYDSAYDMHPMSPVVNLVKSDNPGQWPRVFTVDETGQDGTCPACIEVVDADQSTVGWAADRLSVFTGNHAHTIWLDGIGDPDPIGQLMLQRFIACAIGGFRPAGTCHTYADVFADTPLNIDLYETVRQPYLLCLRCRRGHDADGNDAPHQPIRSDHRCGHLRCRCHPL